MAKSKMAERTRKAAEKDTSKGGNYNVVTLPDGVEEFVAEEKNHINIIPYTSTSNYHPDQLNEGELKGELWWRRPYRVHKDIGVDNITVVCLRSFNKKCPICEQLAPLRGEYTKNKAIIDKHGDKQRVLYGVEDLIADDKVVKVWDISHHLFGKKLGKELKADEAYEGFAEPKGGMSLKIRMEKKSFNSRDFLDADRIDFVEREDLGKRILKNAVNLDELLIEMSYEELENIFLEVDSEEIPSDNKETDPLEDSIPDDAPDSEDLVGRTVVYKEDGEICKVISQEGIDITIRDKEGNDWDVEVGDVELDSTGSSGDAPDSEDKVCPDGYVYGRDCDKNPKHCGKCDKWDDCVDEKERLEKEGSKSSSARTR